MVSHYFGLLVGSETRFLCTIFLFAFHLCAASLLACSRPLRVPFFPVHIARVNSHFCWPVFFLKCAFFSVVTCGLSLRLRPQWVNAQFCSCFVVCICACASSFFFCSRSVVFLLLVLPFCLSHCPGSEHFLPF